VKLILQLGKLYMFYVVYSCVPGNEAVQRTGKISFSPVALFFPQ